MFGDTVAVASSFPAQLQDPRQHWMARHLELVLRLRFEAQHGWEFENAWPMAAEQAAIREARAKGIPIYGESLHQYMLYTAEDYKKPNGQIFHTYPSLKSAQDQAEEQGRRDQARQAFQTQLDDIAARVKAGTITADGFNQILTDALNGTGIDPAGFQNKIGPVTDAINAYAEAASKAAQAAATLAASSGAASGKATPKLLLPSVNVTPGRTLMVHWLKSAFGVMRSASQPCTFRSVPVTATGSKNAKARS